MLPSTVSSVRSTGATRTSNADSSIDMIDVVVCSFALHLVESSSELFALLRELSTKALWLVVLAPHKKPEVTTRPLLVCAWIQDLYHRSKKGGAG